VAKPEGQRRLSAILFTDAVGSSRVTGADEREGLRLRDRHRAPVRGEVERYRGRLIETPGDETLSTFESALDAVSAALAIRGALAAEPGLVLHTGVHLGETLFRGARFSAMA
jgi:adenylate cyclase